ncbi:NADPH:adrenodoxin oxidoreductase, mitochondrial [Pseudolycoriella hygida]|uniref:NADPH:adrenodoxin oxidoreductase, mitochondrial n=1 Tax=Pseudolycoriella hygida TaxID=35572 RepID=A0A9Q0N6E2_9DIPT|nr:NADPH:adrenodoxin oxidoreductase, mitochondrial [Pseudolycoriella hygida]
MNVIKHFNKSFTTSVLGSNTKKKVCVVGAGPAGFYAAQHLIKNLPDCYVDIVEKLPVPFGLVRFGVAPDHPEVKNVINTFTKTAENPRVKFLGNLTLGFDFSLQDLRNRYHAVILSYGAEKDRKLNIPNEYPSNVLSAREFVAWYNGLPGTENYKPNLNAKTVAVIGQGNVAIDVSRILLSPIDALVKTDITHFALQTLSESKVEKVYLIGRRGPLQAAFTIKELREMTKLSGVNICWRGEDFVGISEELSNLPRPRKRLTELMLSSLSQQQQMKGQKSFLPIFLRSPQQIDSSNNLVLSINNLVGNSAVATSVTETLQTDLIMRSIGYKSICLDKQLNFDEKQGLVNNVGGRVLKKQLTGSDNSIDDIEDKFEKGLYVSGWLATGPTGVILTTMNNSFSVAHAVCEDFKSGAINSTNSKPGLDDILVNKTVVTWDGWNRIDRAEIEAGKKSQKPREKIVNIKKMLELVS